MASTASERATVQWQVPRADVLADVCLVGCWLWLIRPSFSWIVDNLTRESGRLSLLLVVVVVGLAIFKTLESRRAGERLRLGLSPAVLPLLLFIAGGIAFVACERFVGVNRVSLFAAGLGTYGLAGLYVPPAIWRRGFVPGLLLLMVLPMAEQIDVYLGFPARVWTAEIVHGALAGLVEQDITAQTILVFENGAAQVDLPCSGVKSLWAGAVLSLAATWLDARRIGWKWLACNALFVVLLLSANAVRVLALVLVGLVFGRPAAAELMHVSLGLIGFALSAVVLLVLYRLVVRQKTVATDCRNLRRPASSLRVRVLLVGFAFLLAAAWAPRPDPVVTAQAADLRLPAGLVAEPVGLEPLEAEHFEAQGALQVSKYRFAWRGTTGSFLVVLTDSFRAHHLPDRCITGAGLTIERRRTELLDASRPISRVDLQNHCGEAAYWFQSSDRTTEDYSARVWADVSGAERRWVLVSVLLDERTSQADELFGLLHDAVHASFFGGTS